MASEKVHFTGVRETSLITLYARALQQSWPNPILADPWAAEAVRRIDYDFERLRLYPFQVIAVASRAQTFDHSTQYWLGVHPDATVLHLGCGLDSRVYRINPPPGVRWFDVDYPDVIDLHRKLYPDREGYQRIGVSLEGLTWMHDFVPPNAPTLILAEGVTMYLRESSVRLLFHWIAEKFPSGRLIFDAVNRLEARVALPIHHTGARYSWWLNDPEDITKMEPKLRFLIEFGTSQMIGFERNTQAFQVFIGFLERLNIFRRMNRKLIYEF